MVNLSQSVLAVANWLVLVHPRANDEETKQSSQLLSGLLLASFVVPCLVIALVVHYDPDDLYDPRTYATFSIVFVAVILYAANRRGYVRLARDGFIAFLSGVFVSVPYFESFPEFAAFTVIPMLLAGMFYSFKPATGLVILIVSVVWVLNMLVVDSSIWQRRIIWYFLLFAGVLVLTFKFHLNNLEAIRRRKLDGANAQLRISEAQLEQRVSERTSQLEAMNQQLIAANEQLQTLSKAKDDFVSNVSHELRTPIANLLLRQYLLTNTPGEIDKHLGVMQRETKRLQYTVETLLHLSRWDQGRVELNIGPVNIDILAMQYVADRIPLAEQKRLSLGFSAESDLPPVMADEGLLGQVLSILLTNAINYTPAGGQVTVTMQIRRDGASWKAGFSVSDTGLGVSPAEQPHLFERSFRGTVGRESKTPGTGLGLALAKKIVDSHDGWIEVHSEGIPGRGTTFSVWLPIQRPVNHALPDDAALSSDSGQ